VIDGITGISSVPAIKDRISISTSNSILCEGKKMKEGKRKRGRPMSADPISRKQKMVSTIPRISNTELGRSKPSKESDVNIARMKKSAKITTTSSFSSSSQCNNLDKNSSLDPVQQTDKKFSAERSTCITEFPHSSNMSINKQNRIPQGCSKQRKMKKKLSNKLPIKEDVKVSLNDLVSRVVRYF
jgi:hypothetical protein